MLPAQVVAWMLEDTRKIPYLLIWKSRSDGTIKEAARIAPYYEAAAPAGPDWTGAFEIKRHSVPLRRAFVWNTWAVAGIITLVFAAILSIRRLSDRP